MQRYILGAEPPGGCALIQCIDPLDGKWRRYNAGIVYLAADVQALAKRALESFEPRSLYSHESEAAKEKLLQELRAIVGGETADEKNRAFFGVGLNPTPGE